MRGHDRNKFCRLIRHRTADVHPTPLEVLSADAYAALPPQEQDWGKLLNFSFETPSIWPLASDDSDSVRVSTGDVTPSASDPWWMAGVCEKLPEGYYAFQDQFDDETLASGALGWLLAHYCFDRYRSKPEPIPQRVLLLPKSIDLDPIIEEAASIALVRDLVNTPAEDMGPAELQAAAKALANTFGGKINVIVGEDLLKENLASIYTVGRAALPCRAPRLIELEWGDKAHPSVTLIGKGVCFDTGGLGLKLASKMRRMKKDMAGAAHALGLARQIMAMQLPIQLRVLIPAVDNNISKQSYRPGDVISTRKGFTVEIDHTDAEGRLILCDALALASEQDPDILLDFATLTSANSIAVGPDIASTYTPSDELWDVLDFASKTSGDPVWRMPLWAPYKKKLASDIADLNHRTPAFEFAGGITAALFLQHFVSSKVQWAHFDFYAWHDEALPGRPKGSAVMAIRTAFRSIQALFKTSSD